MIAICPIGPPKLMKPSFNQYQKAWVSVTGSGGLVLSENCCCDASMIHPWETLRRHCLYINHENQEAYQQRPVAEAISSHSPRGDWLSGET